jgi:hypothetical protein
MLAVVELIRKLRGGTVWKTQTTVGRFGNEIRFGLTKKPKKDPSTISRPVSKT